jgi:hypothetical protein
MVVLLNDATDPPEVVEEWTDPGYEPAREYHDVAGVRWRVVSSREVRTDTGARQVHVYAVAAEPDGPQSG